jgi:hypothetical protein
MSNQTVFKLREFSVNDLDECVLLYRQMVDY